MALQYKYYEISTLELSLDIKNPRFASSTLVDSTRNTPQEKDIITHLLKHADIIALANSIEKNHCLHGSEIVTCYKDENGKLIVAEGNRRICACKLLLDKKLIPKEYIDLFPSASKETIENISSILVNVYPNRASIQSYLSDRHIAGVKKWSTLEKNNYYMNLFQQYHDIDIVKSYTGDTVSIIKKSVIEYQFFMDVFKVLKSKNIDLEIEKIDYLPLADRFMNILVGDDNEVGLSLKLDTNNYLYLCPDHKRKVYEQILLLVGQAFLVRKGTDIPTRVIGSDVSNNRLRKSLIMDDVKIPGLYMLIKEYKGISEKNSTYSTKSDGESARDESANQNGTNEEGIFDPQIPEKYIPKKHRMDYLCFSEDESQAFILSDNEYDIKIKEIIHELSTIKPVNNPVACACLYRCLLEMCARRVYSKKANTSITDYDEKSLLSNLSYINNNVAFNGSNNSEISKLKKAIKNQLGKDGVVDILNLYIHYPSMVDTTILINSWTTMKIFICRCLSI